MHYAITHILKPPPRRADHMDVSAEAPPESNGTAPDPPSTPSRAAGEEPRLSDRMAALRDIASALRSSPEAEDTLRFVVERVRAATGADGAVLALRAPVALEVAAGAELGDGPRLTAGLHAAGSVLGEIVLARSPGRPPFSTEDEGLVDLVINYLSKAAGSLRPHQAFDPAEQRFITTLGDELRSPLSTVGGMIDAVLSEAAGPVSEHQRAFLGVAGGEAKRLNGLIADLITLTQLRPPEPRDLEVIAVLPWLARAAAARQPEMAARGLAFELDAPAEPCLARVVAPQVEKVVHHLLDNAIKFSSPGGTITLGVAPEGEHVRITVADEGLGFDAAAAVRIFDRFARAATAEEAGIPGAGLGLAIVREIVSLHGGRAWAESRRGEGSRLHITLPAA